MQRPVPPSALLAICAGNSPVIGEFPAQRPVTRSFDVIFDLSLNKRLSKQSWGWWFETPSRPLLSRHCNAYAIILVELTSLLYTTPAIKRPWKSIIIVQIYKVIYAHAYNIADPLHCCESHRCRWGIYGIYAHNEATKILYPPNTRYKSLLGLNYSQGNWFNR